MELIDIRKIPPYFTGDSIERGIFVPASDTHASEAELRALLSDAKFYADQWAPDRCPAGLQQSARAVIRWLAKRGVTWKGEAN